MANLQREADFWSRRWNGPAFDTVYFGGGTPSMLAPGQLADLLAGLRAALPISADAWWSLEANPEDCAPAHLAALRALGFGTLSLGIQSFEARALKFLGRRHTPEQARESVLAARGAGFPIVSADLIFGLPGGELAASLDVSLDAVIELAPEHVSGYQLTFHEGTPFGRALDRGRLRELPEPDQARAFEVLHQRLAAAGYTAYEVSNFAREPRWRSRHNQKYWHGAPYLGLGPGAHSFDGHTQRWWNERDLGAWQAKLATGELPCAGRERLSRNQQALETLMLALRTTDGLDLAAFSDRFGVDLVSRNRPVLERWAAAGQITLDARFLRPTLAGLAVADALVRELQLGSG